jgi:hypothetical protein
MVCVGYGRGSLVAFGLGCKTTLKLCYAICDPRIFWDGVGVFPVSKKKSLGDVEQQNY